MIRGRFGENGQIYFEIDLIDNEGVNIAVEARLDTGFTEFIVMNQQDIESLEQHKESNDQKRLKVGGECPPLPINLLKAIPN